MVKKNGFTLMELLAVIMMIALIASFAVPAYRSIRAERQFRRARSAAVLLLEGIRQAKQKTGRPLPSPTDFTPTTGIPSTDGCTDDAATGIPRRSNIRRNGENYKIEELFACGYVNSRDFEKLPYKFQYTYVGDAPSYITFTGIDGAGKYEGRSFKYENEKITEVE